MTQEDTDLVSAQNRGGSFPECLPLQRHLYLT